MSSSRLGGLHKLTVAERIDELCRLGWLSAANAEVLKQGRHVLLPADADTMVENVIGTFSLPLAIAPNFIVNGREYMVPMVIEEPSVVAALSFAAKLARPDGYTAHYDEYLLAGQVHVTRMPDIAAAVAALQAAKPALLEQANKVHPNLVRRGGGARDIVVRQIELGDGNNAVAVHLLVDTCDAMGANLVNSMCEALAPGIGEICGGEIALRILSNLADRSVVKASVRYRLDELATAEFTAEAVRDRIIQASEIAAADPYRAATHNKGIMNGVDALALATGNDWRAIEAGAHAYAAKAGSYAPLARWSGNAEGDLLGELVMPLRAATVGGTLPVNSAARLALGMSGARSARELGELMAAVGLAQNFAAIRALATRGIQEGHMRLHARSRAEKSTIEALDKPMGRAAGKVILFGEHAVVYGKSGLALPIPDAVTTSVATGEEGDPYYRRILETVHAELGIALTPLALDVRSSIPPGMGLGSSAALAAAITRACARHHGIELPDERVNRVAFACERIAHGNPSGIDNTIATYALPMLFRRDGDLQYEEMRLSTTPPLVIAFSSQPGSTREQVEAVAERYAANASHFDAVFDQMDTLARDGARALQDGDYATLGALMNVCHGLLNAIGVSTAEIESIVSIARSAGAAGAKLTGGGGGGSVVALCPGRVDDVRAALAAAGFATMSLTADGDN